MRTRFGRAALLAVLLSSISSALPAAAQEGGSGEAVPPPPAGSSAELAAPQPQPQVVVQQPVQAQPVQAQPVQAQGQPVQGQPVQGQAAAAYGQPVYGPAGAAPYPGQPMAPPQRHGERLEDTANAGEVIDLMITSGAYGIFLANSIVTWTDLDVGVSSEDQIRVRFVATILGAAFSLSGLLALEAPRGVPTTMAMGLRYGLAWGAFGAAAGGVDGDGVLAAMTIGGVVGLGLGTGLGFGLRPHPSRSRFVETGFFWGTALGGMLGGAFSNVDGRAVLAGMLIGGVGAMGAHMLVAGLTPVHIGRGWLMNAAFAAGTGLAAFFTWGFAGASASAEAYLATMSATGFVALGVIFALTDGIQDPGWDESVPEVVRSMRLDIGPTQGGAVGTLSGQF